MVDSRVEAIEVGEGPMRKVTRFQIPPDDFDVVQLGGVFGQPFDGEPVGTFGQRRPAGLADVDGSIVEDKDHRLHGRPGSGTVEAVERLQMRDEIGAPLGPGRRDDQLALGVIERAHHRDLLRLSGRWNPKIREGLIGLQVKDNTCAKGSWDPFSPVPDIWAERAGRLYLTSMSILTLEVYYRYLPLYRTADDDQEKMDSSPALKGEDDAGDDEKKPDPPPRRRM